MPRKKIPSPRETREWLEMREGGWSEAAIANNVGREIRTVRKYLRKAADERRLNQAQLELVKKALEAHQSQLVEAVSSLLLSLNSQPEKVHLPWPLTNHRTIDANGVVLTLTTNQNGIETEVSLQAEQDEIFNLLKEHLATDPLLNELVKWKSAYRSFIVALAVFREKVAVTLVEQMNGRFVDETLKEIHIAVHPGQKSTESTSLLTLNLLEFVYRQSLDQLPGSVPQSDMFAVRTEAKARLQQNIIINVEHGEVTLGHGQTLVVCHGRETFCKEAIIDSLDRLPQTAEGKQICITQKRLAEAATQLSRTLREIRLGILIPGECRVCLRFKG